MAYSLTLLYSPFPTIEAARAAAQALLEARVVACCNLIPVAESMYWWEGKLASNPETILIAKTLPEHREEARDLLAQHHPYECPAILVLGADANAPFAAWVASQTATATKS